MKLKACPHKFTFMSVASLMILCLMMAGPVIAQDKKTGDIEGQKSGYTQPEGETAQPKEMSTADTQENAAQNQGKTDNSPARSQSPDMKSQTQKEKMNAQSRAKGMSRQDQKKNMTSEQNQAGTEQSGQGAEFTAIIIPGGQYDENMANYRGLVGRNVRGARGDDIGEVDNVVVSQDGSQVSAVLDVGGFLGIGDKKVLVSLDELQFDPTTDYVVYPGTEQDLESHAQYQEPDERNWGERRGYAGRSYDRPYNRGYHRGYDMYSDRGYDYGPRYYDRRAYMNDGRWYGAGRGYYGMQNQGRQDQLFPTDSNRYARGYYEDRQGERYPYRGGSYNRDSGDRDRQWDSWGDDRSGW
ncbi:MAG: PRC-barrel domain-containing protein [Desulfobacterales bacterium]